LITIPGLATKLKLSDEKPHASASIMRFKKKGGCWGRREKRSELKRIAQFGILTDFFQHREHRRDAQREDVWISSLLLLLINLNFLDIDF
jgi:hypothetical protein